MSKIFLFARRRWVRGRVGPAGGRRNLHGNRRRCRRGRASRLRRRRRFTPSRPPPASSRATIRRIRYAAACTGRVLLSTLAILLSTLCQFGLQHFLLFLEVIHRPLHRLERIRDVCEFDRTSILVRTLIEFSKLQPHSGPIRSFVKAWPQPQPAKRRLRPIFEPFLNASLDRTAVLPLSYPSRLERRAVASSFRFVAEFDFAAFYDQIDFDASVRPYFVLRTKVAGRDALFDCTRLCMGFVPAVTVAQHITWTLVLPLTDFASTMIDNVRIGASTPGAFLSAVKTFLDRCDRARITINDRDLWELDDAGIVQRGHRDWVGPFAFLGEEFRGHIVMNQTKHVNNLQAVFGDILESSSTTRRRFAALVGLIVFLAHTIDLGLWRLFSLLRAYARLVTPSSIESGDVLWDEPIHLAPSVVDSASRAVTCIAVNRPSILRPLRSPGVTNESYDTIIVVDASLAGWAAFIKLPTGVWDVRAGWSSQNHHSANSEPKAALAALKWACFQHQASHIAVVSDHRALATGQRRWWSSYGGFSNNYWLNAFYEAFYDADLSQCRRDVFYVAGEANPADGPSRSVVVGEPLSSRVATSLFPDVAHFDHPFRDRRKIEYQV